MSLTMDDSIKLSPAEQKTALVVVTISGNTPVA